MKKMIMILIVLVLPVFLLAADAVGLLEKAENAKDSQEKLELYKKAYIEGSGKNLTDEQIMKINDSTDRKIFFSRLFPSDIKIITGLIKAYISAVEKQSLDDLLKIFDNLYVIDEIDIDGDGKKEVIMGKRLFLMILRQNGNKINYYEDKELFDCEYKIARVFNVKDSMQKQIIISACSQLLLFGFENNEIKKLMTFSTGEIPLKMEDLDNDGVDEILCGEEFEYKRAYSPLILKWNGIKLYRATLEYPDNFIAIYKQIKPKFRVNADKYMTELYPGYKDFTQKYPALLNENEDEGAETAQIKIKNTEKKKWWEFWKKK